MTARRLARLHLKRAQAMLCDRSISYSWSQ